MLAQMMRYGDGTTGRDFSNGYWGNHPMMGWASSNIAAYWIFTVLWLATWVLIIAALVALVRLLWKKGDKR